MEGGDEVEALGRGVGDYPGFYRGCARAGQAWMTYSAVTATLTEDDE